MIVRNEALKSSAKPFACLCLLGVLELHPTAIAGLSFLSSTYRCVEDIRMVQRDKMNSL